jgi:hypothetical protein
MTIWTIKYSGRPCNRIVNLKREILSHDVRICTRNVKFEATTVSFPHGFPAESAATGKEDVDALLRDLW